MHSYSLPSLIASVYVAITNGLNSTSQPLSLEMLLQRHVASAIA